MEILISSFLGILLLIYLYKDTTKNLKRITSETKINKKKKQKNL